MRNSNGFSLIETLVALSILVTVISIFIPIQSKIMIERDVLNQNQVVSNVLHEELQKTLWSNQLIPEDSYIINVDGSPITINFTLDKSLLKGCAKWENAKKMQQQSCLYGYHSK